MPSRGGESVRGREVHFDEIDPCFHELDLKLTLLASRSSFATISSAPRSAPAAGAAVRLRPVGALGALDFHEFGEDFPVTAVEPPGGQSVAHIQRGVASRARALAGIGERWTRLPSPSQPQKAHECTI
jgi:hypothetical protein